MAKILLTGASGMLGKQIFSKISLQQKHEIFTVSRNEFEISENHFIGDIANPHQLLQILNECKPEIVINCAAYVNLDYCEKNHLETNMLHQDAVSTLSTYPSVESLYYISTDSVFDGQRGNYSEDDITNPLNYYATSKLNGEYATLKYAKKAFIIRTNILGFNSKTGKSLFEWAYQNLFANISIGGYTNVYFNPLYVGDLAQMLIEFLNINCDPGIYNFASQRAISKYSFLLKIANVIDCDVGLIKPIILNNSNIDTIRPLNTTLTTSKITNLGINVPTIDICINNLYNDFLDYGIRI
jgi:dTDP-4-dehydrorhamnose reductase